MQWRYVPLTPKAFGTLAVLVEHLGRIVEKKELISQVWPDAFVEEVSLGMIASTEPPNETHRYCRAGIGRKNDTPGISFAWISPRPPC